jgi:hypothetical protein
MSEGLMVRQNEALLSQFELGGIVLDAFDAAIQVDPRLQDMLILPLDDGPESTSMGMAVPKWSTRAQRYRHEIHIPLGEPEATFDFIAEQMKRVPKTFDILSARLGIQRKHYTPKVAFGFVALHEMGHVSQYFDYGEDPASLLDAMHEERSALPFTYAPPSALATERSSARQALEANWDTMRKRQYVSTIDEFIEKQAVAYRNMPSEANADYFAAEVLTDNPDLMEMLLAS